MDDMRKMPLVSVGVPVFNGEKFIRNAMDSLLKQDYENIEIIVSDNCSTDNTAKIVNEYQEKCDFIKIHRNTENIGAHSNFIKLLEFSNGKYFMWAAIDDYWSSEFISTLVNELEMFPEIGIAMCAFDKKRTNGTLKDSIHFRGYQNPNRKGHLGMALALTSPLKYNVFIYGLFRTNLLRSAIDQLLPIPSGDRWFLIQFAMAYRFRYVDKSLHVRTIHEDKFWKRYPDELFSQKRELYSLKKFNFQRVIDLYSVLKNSSIIPAYRRKLIPVVILSLFIWRLIKGVRKIGKDFFSRIFPKKIKSMIKSLTEMSFSDKE